MTLREEYETFERDTARLVGWFAAAFRGYRISREDLDHRRVVEIGVWDHAHGRERGGWVFSVRMGRWAGSIPADAIRDEIAKPYHVLPGEVALGKGKDLMTLEKAAE